LYHFFLFDKDENQAPIRTRRRRKESRQSKRRSQSPSDPESEDSSSSSENHQRENRTNKHRNKAHRVKKKPKPLRESPSSPNKMARSDKEKNKVYRETLIEAGFQFDKYGNPVPPSNGPNNGGQAPEISADPPPPAKKAKTVTSHGHNEPADGSKALEALSTQMAIQSKKKGGTSASKELVSLIERTVKEDTWRVVKFQNTPKERRDLTVMVLNKLNLPGFQLGKAEDEENRANWINAYEGIVCKSLNGHRNYVQNRIMLNAGYPWIRGPGKGPLPTDKGKMPSKERMHALNIRDLDPESDADYALWKWWHTQVMPPAVGHRKGWGPDRYCYLTIGRGAPPNAPKKLYVPPSTEAIAQAMVENSRSKWENTVELMNSGRFEAGCVYRPTGKINRNADGSLAFDCVLKVTKLGVKTVHMNDPKHHGKHTLTTMGQTIESGWNADGRKFFQEAETANRAARKKGKFHRVEKKMLAKLKEELHIQGNSPDEEAALKAQEKKRAAAAAVPAEPLEEMTFLEEEDLELEDDDDASTDSEE